MRATALLRELQELRYDFGKEAAARKKQLLHELESRNLPRAREVFDLHEELCFLRAYPPDAEARERTGRMLASFDKRNDCKRFRRRLADTGIAGTAIDFRFYWLTAIWMLRQGWGPQLAIDWKAFDAKKQLPNLLHLLLPFAETPALDSFDYRPKEWIDRLKAKNESDAEFLIARFDALKVPTPLREKLYEDLDVPMRLKPGPTTPARGRDEWPDARIVYPEKAPQKRRPARMKDAIRKVEFTVRRLKRSEGRFLIDLANRCLVPRHRDLLIFLYADPDDARMIDFGDGLSFFCVGAVPERRLVLESVYGFLTLMNGYPIGYLLCSAFFGSAEVAYNIFETFRGRGAAQVYARVLGMVHKLFGADTFAVDPYQLGHDNDEGLASGAWWFYYKLGFRPHDAGIRTLVREELAELRDDPSYRTPRARLNRLSADYMFLHLGEPRDDVLGHLSLGDIGLRVSENLAARFGADREKGVRAMAREAAERLGQDRKKLSKGERIAWERWAPLVDVLPGLDRWSRAEKRALADVIRAKGGRSEAKYVERFDAHAKLRRALRKLAE